MTILFSIMAILFSIMTILFSIMTILFSIMTIFSSTMTILFSIITILLSTMTVLFSTITIFLSNNTTLFFIMSFSRFIIDLIENYSKKCLDLYGVKWIFHLYPSFVPGQGGSRGENQGAMALPNRGIVMLHHLFNHARARTYAHA